MKHLKKLIFFVFFQFITLTILAQEQESILRLSGKIYVVVSVLVTIFLGLIIYLLSIDKKITRLENQKKKEEQ